MPLREFIEYLAREWTVIRSAPVTFLVAFALILALAWWSTNQLYAARFDGQKEAISVLEARLRAKDDDIARKTDRITDLEKQNAARPQTKSEQFDPNGLYQRGVKVGIASGANRNLGNSVVNFELIDASSEFDPNIDFKYQDLVLRLKGYEFLARNGGMGVVERQRFSQASCRVVSR